MAALSDRFLRLEIELDSARLYAIRGDYVKTMPRDIARHREYGDIPAPRIAGKDATAAGLPVPKAAVHADRVSPRTATPGRQDVCSRRQASRALALPVQDPVPVAREKYHVRDE